MKLKNKLNKQKRSIKWKEQWKGAKHVFVKIINKWKILLAKSFSKKPIKL